MHRLQKMMILVLIMGLSCASAVGGASAEMQKKIILFHEGARPQDVDDYVARWQVRGGTNLMQLPFINGLIMGVPEEITLAELADDPLVASVEEDQPVILQALRPPAGGGPTRLSQPIANLEMTPDLQKHKNRVHRRSGGGARP